MTSFTMGHGELVMRHALAGLCGIHAIAHLVGFAVPWRLVTSIEQPYVTTILQGRLDLGDWGIRLYGLGWLILAISFAAIAIGVVLRSSWWLSTLEIACVISLLFSVLSWPGARLGVLVNILVIALAFASIRFERTGLAIKDDSLEKLWESASTGSARTFESDTLSTRYLMHVVRPGAVLPSRVRMKMHGEIKLGRWWPFRAEQVITRDGNFVWAATVSIYGFPIRGADRLLKGNGAMRWMLLDLIPVMSGSGPDVTRSAIGRLQGELAAWLPSVFPEDGFHWLASNAVREVVRVQTLGESADIELEIDGNGALKTLKLPRWGNPDGGEYRYVDFGMTVEEDRRFQGFTVPTRIRAGWFIGSDRFQSEGEFFRASIDTAEFK